METADGEGRSFPREFLAAIESGQSGRARLQINVSGPDHDAAHLSSILYLAGRALPRQGEGSEEVPGHDVNRAMPRANIRALTAADSCRNLTLSSAFPVSAAIPAHAATCSGRRSGWRTHLRGIGAENVAVMPTAGYPVVYGEWLGAGRTNRPSSSTATTTWCPRRSKTAGTRRRSSRS